MLPRVKAVRHIDGFRLRLTFTDGTSSDLDFRSRVDKRGGVFMPLADESYFRQVHISPEAGTIVWPNGVDFCPDVLHAWAAGRSGALGEDNFHESGEIGR